MMICFVFIWFECIQAAIPEVEEIVKPIEPILDTPDTQTLDKDAIAEIMKDPDPKWQNSKFLNFLRDLSEEKIKLTENDVVPNPDYVEKGDIKVRYTRALIV